MTIDDHSLNRWFCCEILPREAALIRFIQRNWRVAEDVVELRQDIYVRVLTGARDGLPVNAGAYLFTVARHHLINQAMRARIVSIETVADLEKCAPEPDLDATDRYLDARDQLRRTQAGLATLPPRCREVVRLRKVEGLSTREAADRLGIGTDTVERQLTLGIRALVDFMLGGTGKVRRAAPARRRRGALP